MHNLCTDGNQRSYRELLHEGLERFPILAIFYMHVPYATCLGVIAYYWTSLTCTQWKFLMFVINSSPSTCTSNRPIRTSLNQNCEAKSDGLKIFL